MDEHDEAFEAIPWDRFSAREPRFDPRLAVVAVVLLVAVGAGAFALRRVAVPVVPAVPVVEAIPASPTSTSSTVATEPSDLWAAPEVEPVGGVAARFLVGLLEGSGVAVSSVLEVEAVPGRDRSTVVVEALGTAPAGTLVRLAMAVDVAPDGTVVSWEPRQVEPLQVRPLTEGAMPPPDVLDGLARVAARWGTALEVSRSGIDGDRWWAEFLVEFPGGGAVPLVVWEG